MGAPTFKKKWGISCNDLAEQEGVTPEAIRMRVKNYGTPFQRRKSETKFEKKYGKTLGQIALDLGLHPQTIARREHLFGDVYREPTIKNGVAGKVLNDRGEHWWENSKMGYFKTTSTFMPQHDKGKDE
mgnify:FL=1